MVRLRGRWGRHKKPLEKFDKTSVEGIFLAYCENNRSFRVYNRRTLVIEETIHITFDESNGDIFISSGEDDDAGIVIKPGPAVRSVNPVNRPLNRAGSLIRSFLQGNR